MMYDSTRTTWSMDDSFNRKQYPLGKRDSLILQGNTIGRRSYLSLLHKNNAFRLFLLSYITNHIGEWLTYLASIEAIQEISKEQGLATHSNSLISALIIVRLLSNLISTPFGGVLADGRDRRRIMIVLDLCGGLLSWLFIFAIQMRSIPFIFVAGVLQDCLAGLYEPSRSAIIPLLVPEEEEQKDATTLTGVVWSVVAAVGAATGGLLVSSLGQRNCYVIDSFTYVISACLMYSVNGTWKAASCDVSREQLANWSCCSDMIAGGLEYIWSSSFGALIFLKASGELFYGPFDVLNVAISERGITDDWSTRLGLLYCAIGVGSWAGPLLVDSLTDMNRPQTLIDACLWSVALAAVGSFFMGAFDKFGVAVALNVIRCMGSSALWVNSSLLLQKFSKPDMLGRVNSIEWSLTLLAQSISVAVTGYLLDQGTTVEELSESLGILGGMITLLWTYYFFCQDVYGKAHFERQQRGDLESSSSLLNETTPLTNHLSI